MATKFKPATPPDKIGPTSSTFDVSDRDSMGDPEFVSGQVRAMMEEARKALFEAPNPQAAIPGIIDRWADRLWAGNPDYIQTLSPASQAAFLRSRGCGSSDPEDDHKAPVKALLAATLDQLVEAILPFHKGEIDAEQFGFAVATAAEDCVMALMGLDNPAD